MKLQPNCHRTDIGEHTMNKKQNAKIRYVVEHKILPNILFSVGPRFVIDMAKDASENLYELYRLNQRHIPSYQCPYSPKDFSSRLFIFATGNNFQSYAVIVCLNMPKPEDQLLCYRIYLCWESSTERIAYFTVERDTNCGYPMLCRWTKSGNHINYGPSPNNAEEELKSVCFFFNYGTDISKEQYG
jgi:hypothetical protein